MKKLLIALCGILSVATGIVAMSDGGKGEVQWSSIPGAEKLSGTPAGVTVTIPRARVVTGNPGGKDEISSTLRAKVKATPSAALRATVQADIAAASKKRTEEGAELPE